MGYRHYFYKVNKKEVDEVKDLSYGDLCIYAKNHDIEIYDDGGFYFNDKKFLNKIEIFEFGKLYWDNTASRIYDSGKPLFTNEDTQKHFDDYVPYIVGKQGLLTAIQIYKENVLKVYKDMLVDGAEYRMAFGITVKKEDVKPIEKLRGHIEDKLQWIEGWDRLVDTDETNLYSLTSSWQYEHAIFNLVHLLKTIDWEKETILFYGW